MKAANVPTVQSQPATSKETIVRPVFPDVAGGLWFEVHARQNGKAG